MTVSQLRESHSCLNFYTTDQLVLLSSQLAALVHKGAPLLSESAMLLNLLATGMVDSRYTAVPPFFLLTNFSIIYYSVEGFFECRRYRQMYGGSIIIVLSFFSKEAPFECRRH